MGKPWIELHPSKVHPGELEAANLAVHRVMRDGDLRDLLMDVLERLRENQSIVVIFRRVS
jgi:hypothetical protein